MAEKADRGLSALARALGVEELAGETEDQRRDREGLERRLASLADLLEPATPSNDLFARIAAKVDLGTPLAGIHVARSDSGVWRPFADGITVKTLWRSLQSGRSALILRMQPGAIMPPHDHEGDEETLVLEGDLQVNGVEFGPGDFQVAFAGTRHPVITTRGGCLCYVSLAH